MPEQPRATSDRAVPAPSSRGIDPADIAALRAAVRGVCSGLWASATCATDGDLAGVWAGGARQGWFELAAPELFGAAVTVQEEFGRIACPVPVVDAALACGVLEARGDHALVAAIAAGSVRPVIAQAFPDDPGTGLVARHVEAADTATHLLAIDYAAGQLAWYGLDGARIDRRAGLSVPAWSDVRPLGPPEWVDDLASQSGLLLRRRVGLAARAAAAVSRTHELAVEHACQRQQFGRPVGSFQAVSHRLVDVETMLTAAGQLLDHALALQADAHPDWPMAAEIYLEFVGTHLARLQFDGHHTLAAIGYFEEHEAPWLFRRAHADLAVLAGLGTPDSVGVRLIRDGGRLPAFDLGPQAEQLRQEVLEAFEPWMSGPPSHFGSWDPRARAVLRDRGWVGVSWPEELGGRGFGVSEVSAFSEALAYANPPLGNILMGINSIAPMLIKVGPPHLRDLVLGEVRRGELSIALGYSEPEAGSDLASLRTRAVQVDGGWLVNGQKLWGTCLPDSRWVLLAARTDPAATRPQAGISLFLVDTDSPGLTVQEHRALGGDISATTFWDDVFVPDSRLVGQVNKGWEALGAALAAERVLIGASVMRVHRVLERLIALVSSHPDLVSAAHRDNLAAEVGRLAVRLQAARALVNAGVAATISGSKAGIEAPMAKVMATELAEELNTTAVALLGPDTLYRHGVAGAVGDGHFEDGLRSSIMGVVAGGTNDIQRNLIARAMGLPR